MPNIKCHGRITVSEKMCKHFVDAGRTDARTTPDDGQTGTMKAHLGTLRQVS